MSTRKEPSKSNRRATIFVTGPHKRQTIYHGDGSTPIRKTSQEANEGIVRHNHVAVHTASSVEVLVQLFLDEIELLRFRVRQNGARMRHYLAAKLNIDFTKLRNFLFSLFDRSIDKRFMEYQRDEAIILNNLPSRPPWKPPRYTFNDVEEMLTVDDYEEGVYQRRKPKWESLPQRMKPVLIDEDISAFQHLNLPMSMTMEDEDDRLSLPSTRTVMTSEDQMAAIHQQLAMLSRQLQALQRQNVPQERESSSKREVRAEKKSLHTSTSSSSPSSEDEGKGPSLCSPNLPRKKVEADRAPVSKIAPLSTGAPPPPPPPPSMTSYSLISGDTGPTPTKNIVNNSKKLPPPEVVTSDRPYLIEIANGRNLLKKTRPTGAPISPKQPRMRRPVSSFEAALKDRFRCFHGDTSLSEHEETEEEANANWD
ncbi:unnamed protein product [Caenorhabditis auriculariae]|uniref:Uncharacterized protein n=1 Tax=Caenorhabditis auriculariae TaxID=2777116 RepID=A0A8S1H723_9PELO|nr:unnamed protein product [Caenorhabditis auriculariae]